MAALLLCLVLGIGAMFMFGGESYINNPTGTTDGYEYVDLGLPSGIKWATCNVGATSPEEYGDYYAWGETTKTDYTEINYQHHNGSDYVDIGGDISGMQYDVAHVMWGGNWRMPTQKEFQELLDNCTWTWTTYKETNGYKVTGSNGNSIFLPAAGYRNGTELFIRGSVGYYWSSSSYDYSCNYAFGLGFNDGVHNWSYYYSYYGHSVRPVSD